MGWLKVVGSLIEDDATTSALNVARAIREAYGKDAMSKVLMVVRDIFGHHHCKAKLRTE